jgi:hypothetical protein
MLAQFGNSGYSGAMQSSAYWKAELVDRDNSLLEFLKVSQVRSCEPCSGSNGTMIAVTPCAEDFWSDHFIFSFRHCHRKCIASFWDQSFTIDKDAGP